MLLEVTAINHKGRVQTFSADCETLMFGGNCPSTIQFCRYLLTVQDVVRPSEQTNLLLHLYAYCLKVTAVLG